MPGALVHRSMPGANIDCQTFAGKSALHFAAEHQLPELVEVRPP
jgi:ankyrin repeat protein